MSLRFIFPFIQYVRPLWYFNHSSKRNIWIDYNCLSDEDKMLIDYDENYSSKNVSLLDAAYQILLKGIALNTVHKELNIESVIIDVNDNYRFIRKYFHHFWSLYVLLLRLLTLHSPHKELKAFYLSLRIKRKNVYERHKEYESFKDYNSPLIKRNPKVSVIIPTLNRYEVLSDVLHDLEKQDYKNFEVLVVDQSDEFRKEYYEGYKLNIKVYYLTVKGVWNARNYAIRKSVGEFIALSEDDVRIKPDWISSHLKTLCFFGAEISAGVFFPEGSFVPFEKSYHRIAEQFATGNAVLYKKVFKITGLFDEQFEMQRMGDGEFGLRAYINGIISINNPIAYCIDIKAASGGFREFGYWDAFRAKKLFAPKPVPSVLYLARKYFGNKQALKYLLLNVAPSVVPYKYKSYKYVGIISLLFFVLLIPILFIQVVSSWMKATKMIKEGYKIEYFDQNE